MPLFTYEKFVIWGFWPLVMANLGYWLPMTILELLLQTEWGRANVVERQGGREAAAIKNRERVADRAEQLRTAAWVLFGPGAILNGGLSMIIMPAIVGEHDASAWPALPQLALHLVLMELLGDFGLYWGHRVQHWSPFLWKHCHSKHHQMGTPTPMTTVFIDSTDATLQAGLPIVLASALVRPHPLTYNLYVFLRIAENVLNHSGLDAGIVDLISLKALPGRASVRHHDLHHLYMDRGPGAKNFGENFWIWDWAFGTLSSAKAPTA